MPANGLTNCSAASAIPVDAMTKVDDFACLRQDTTDFIGGRIRAG